MRGEGVRTEGVRRGVKRVCKESGRVGGRMEGVRSECVSVRGEYVSM